MIIEGIAKQRIHDELSHLLLCLFEAIEELDHVIDLLIIHDGFDMRFKH